LIKTHSPLIGERHTEPDVLKAQPTSELLRSAHKGLADASAPPISPDRNIVNPGLSNLGHRIDLVPQEKNVTDMITIIIDSNKETPLGHLQESLYLIKVLPPEESNLVIRDAYAMRRPRGDDQFDRQLHQFR